MKWVVRVYCIAMLCFSAPGIGVQAAQQAVSGVVSGKVQQVGFRALILKQAIERNLAGSAQNLANGTVQFSLQGDAERISAALEQLRQGTGKSSDVKISTSPSTPDPSLTSFRVVAWTSTSRKIATPHDLVFDLRPDNSVISAAAAQKIYQGMLKGIAK